MTVTLTTFASLFDTYFSQNTTNFHVGMGVWMTKLRMSGLYLDDLWAHEWTDDDWKCKCSLDTCSEGADGFCDAPAQLTGQ